MRRVTWLNAAALLLAVGLTIVVGRGNVRSTRPPRVIDRAPEALPAKHYQRIVSTNLVTDRLLLEMAEPERILAFSAAAARRPRDGFRYAGKTAVDGFGPLESLIALGPDLVLTNSFGNPGRAKQLRDAGIEVFDLGELRGVQSLVQVTESLGALLGHGDRARRFSDTFVRRMNGVSATLGDRPRRRALFLLVIGSQVQGGTRGTSQHDILTAAGLIDVAARDFRDWPVYSAEQLIALDPEVIVTKTGMLDTVCTYPGADRLRPCREPSLIFQLPAELVDEPGPAMLEAAEELFRLAYP